MRGRHSQWLAPCALPKQVVYLRRPVVVTWGEHLQDGSVLKHAKERQVFLP